jgi:hypothetical protein
VGPLWWIFLGNDVMVGICTAPKLKILIINSLYDELGSAIPPQKQYQTYSIGTGSSGTSHRWNNGNQTVYTHAIKSLTTVSPIRLNVSATFYR